MSGMGGGGSGMPIPFPAGWEVGQEVRQAALISAMPPTPNSGGRWDTAMRGCPTALLLPGDASCYALPCRHLRPARLREEPHICKHGVGASPPKN